jgi:hypothetical protein
MYAKTTLVNRDLRPDLPDQFALGDDLTLALNKSQEDIEGPSAERNHLVRGP